MLRLTSLGPNIHDLNSTISDKRDRPPYPSRRLSLPPPVVCLGLCAPDRMLAYIAGTSGTVSRGGVRGVALCLCEKRGGAGYTDGRQAGVFQRDEVSKSKTVRARGGYLVIAA